MKTYISKLLSIGAVAVLAQVSGALAAWPERAITLIVPFSAGGPTDIISRLLGEPMSRALGQQVVVENVVGAGGTIAVTRVKNSAPDGYTILMGNLGTQAASVGLYPKLAYDPRTDFEPIINTAGTPMIVAAKKDTPFKDFKEFVAYARANPGKLNYGTGGVGATSHLTCLFLDSLLNSQQQHVPFRGSGPALNALVAQQVDYVCDQTVGIVPSIQGGTVKGLVVAIPERLPQLPDMPTAKEQGLPEFNAVGWNALFAPKNTPREIVMKLNEVVRAALKDEKVRTRLKELAANVPAENEQTPEWLGAFVRSEVDKWTPIIKKAGVTVQ
ncbi:MAG: tripartite tricarboxylate transporter substrate binding protein BugD [Pseudolabrys sp.]|nr:tripartite tricarboxylate transporter substrate binding protein BugD [Pseudolabrys sp.]MCW5683396.1 tripartite tricarboxylate transporter substrate binding protein BugD [Pseudolabrys sp.]